MPQHGIARSSKVGKEEITGLLAALRLFIEEGDAARHKNWMFLLAQIAAELEAVKSSEVEIAGAQNVHVVPSLAIARGM